MPVSKDFRVKKGLVVGENIDATSGNLSALEGRFTTSLSAESLSAVNIYGNIIDATYSELSITGGLSSDGLTLTNASGNVGLGTIDSVSATVTSSATAAIFTIPTAQYRSGKIVIQAVSVGVGTDPPASMETSEILYIQGWDGYNITVDWCEYATVGIGSTSIVTYTGIIVGDNVEFRATNNHSQPINFVSSISQLYAVT